MHLIVCKNQIIRHIVRSKFGGKSVPYPELLYDELAKVCFLEDPEERANFSEVVKVIEKQLSKQEIAHFERTDEEYQCTRTNNYLKIGQSD